MKKLLVAMAIALTMTLTACAGAGAGVAKESPAPASAPAACLAALTASDSIIGDVMPKALSQAADLPPLVPRALQAGMTMNTDEMAAITADLQNFTNEITALRTRLDTLRATYITNRDSCRGGS